MTELMCGVMNNKEDKRYTEETINEIAGHLKEVMRLLGEDVEREGLLKTPRRAAKALLYNTSGYTQDADEVLNAAVFTHPGSEIVIVKDIEFYSLCEHHLLPFFGHVSVGYIPNGKIVGLSKIARVVDVFARRLQVQERFTDQLCEEIYKVLPTRGVIVECEAHHMCMKMRGVEKQDTTTVTMQYRGEFEKSALRQEFYKLLERRK